MASTYLERTLGTPTSQRIFTISAWIKRAELTAHNYIIGQNSTNESYFRINSSDQLDFQDRDSGAGASDFGLTSNALLRDVSAWYHVVLSVDTTQATDTNRGKLYINGVLQTLSASTYPPQNYDTMMNLSGATQRVGRVFDYFDGSMAHVHFIDGTAYDASAFGETDATTGIWKPKTAPSVTYGTNGFFLKFENSGAFGTDSSGNSNNFTVNGTMTQTIDTPSNVFATLNPLNSFYSGATFSNGNLKITTTAGQYAPAQSTIGFSTGKWYAEFKATDVDNWTMVGIVGQDATATSDWIGKKADGYAYIGGSSAGGVNSKMNNNISSTYASTYVDGDIISVAVDCDNNYIYFGLNGTWLNSGNPESGASGTGSAFTISSTPASGFYYFAVGNYSGSQTPDWEANFGNGYFGTTAVSSAQNPDDGIGIFEYAVPSGYKALCTKSINAQEYD